MPKMKAEYISKVPVTDYGLALEALKRKQIFINHVTLIALIHLICPELIERVSGSTRGSCIIHSGKNMLFKVPI